MLKDIGRSPTRMPEGQILRWVLREAEKYTFDFRVKRTDGTWKSRRFQLDPIAKERPATTWTRARDKARELKEELLATVVPMPVGGTDTLRDLLGMWLGAKRGSAKKEATLASYEADFVKHWKPLLDLELAAVTPDAITAAIKAARFQSPRTRNKLVTTLSSVLDYGVARQLLDRSPVITLEHRDGREATVATERLRETGLAVEALYHALPAFLKAAGDTSLGRAIQLYALTGLRLEELLRLRVGDVTLLPIQDLRVVRGKNDSSERHVPLTEMAEGVVRRQLAILKQLGLDHSGAFLFPVTESRERSAARPGDRLKTGAVRQGVRAVMKSIGLAPLPARCVTHLLRKLANSVWTNQGLSSRQIRLVLGHKETGAAAVYTFGLREALYQAVREDAELKALKRKVLERAEAALNRAEGKVA